MNILKMDMYKDGGTIEIKTDEGEFCIDDRLFSDYKGKIFKGYPQNDNKNLILNQEKIKYDLLVALKNYNEDKGFFNYKILAINILTN
jgi:hypothetical protein